MIYTKMFHVCLCERERENNSEVCVCYVFVNVTSNMSYTHHTLQTVRSSCTLSLKQEPGKLQACTPGSLSFMVDQTKEKKAI